MTPRSRRGRGRRLSSRARGLSGRARCPSRRARLVLGTAGCTVVLALALGGCGGSSARVRVERRLPPSWVVSFDLRLAPGSAEIVGLGYGGRAIVLSSSGGALRVAIPPRRPLALNRPPGWLGAGWWHVEATRSRLTIDGRSLPVRDSAATQLSLRSETGRPRIAALIVTAAADRGALLLHRLAELHARVPADHFPVGATLADRIVYSSNYWTSGFWPGALWQAASRAPYGAMFSRWALSATIEHLGHERADTHDVGFMYGESSLAAWRALCPGRPRTSPATCARLKASALSAAQELLALAASNPRAGTVPTNDTSHQADTIVDSMMNIPVLPWATSVTGDPRYAQLAAQHAHVIERLLVRRDGSTAQAANFDRGSGRVLSVVTHQGLSSRSTWSRGEGWAVYGFAQAGADLHDRGLLRVALTAANYVASHLPAAGIPRWDYNAPPGAPVDVSAGVITAAGLFHLAQACRSLPGVCARGDRGRWIALARRMLAASLGRASGQPPLGFLGSQVLNEHGHGCWCNGGELSFGLTYALEAVALEQVAAS